MQYQTDRTVDPILWVDPKGGCTDTTGDCTDTTDACLDTLGACLDTTGACPDTLGACLNGACPGTTGGGMCSLDGDGASPVIESDTGEPPGSSRTEPESGGSYSNILRNSLRKQPGSLVCPSCWTFAQIRRWICSRGSNRSYAWNTVFSSGHIVPPEKLGFTTSNSDLSTIMRSVV